MLTKPNTMLLNRVDENGVTTFTAWTDRLGEIASFVKKVVSVKGVPELLERQHGPGLGYWVDISVPTDNFDKVVADIENIFNSDSEIKLCKDFNQTSWNADMLF